MKEFTGNTNKAPTSIVYNGKTINKPSEIADTMGDFFIEKVIKIREGINANTFQAIRTYKSLIPRVENSLYLKKKTMEDVYKVLQNQKSSNSRGNDEVTMKILKTMPQFSSISICHLYNNMVSTGIFPSSLKTAK